MENIYHEKRPGCATKGGFLPPEAVHGGDCQCTHPGILFGHMKVREYSRLFLGSALGIASLFASLFCGAAVALSLPSVPAIRLGAGALSALACLGLLSALGVATGLGPRAAVREEERRGLLRAKARLGEAREARERLASLRIGSAKVAEARDLVVLEAGRFIEEAERPAARDGRPRAAYDPEAVAAIEEALGLVDAWQREADESASERRFHSADAHAFPESEARVAEALRRDASALVAGRDRLAGSPSAPDVVSIEEELHR